MIKTSAALKARFLAPFALVIGMLLGIFPASSALAVGTLDQQATGTSTRWYYIMNNTPLGQTFTAGISGQLDRFTADAFAVTNPSAPLVVDIYLADGSGFPTGSSLATSSVSQTLIPSTVSTVVFDFGSPASVTAGTQYVAVFSTSGSGEYHFENATSVPAGAKGIKPGVGNVGWQNYVDSGVTPNQTSFRFASYVTAASTPTASPDPTLATTGVKETDSAISVLAPFALIAIGAALIFFTRKSVIIKK